MADVMFYEDGIIFDNDDPDFKSESEEDEEEEQHDLAIKTTSKNKRKESNVLRQSFSADCLPNMSCGMIETNGFYSEYPDNSWLLYSESSESLEDYRLDSMIDRLDPYYEAMHESMTLEDLKSQFNSCNSCGVSWGDNHVSLDCLECGGYSLTRPCPLCDGECKSEWTRDVSMSHSVGKAHWDGECTLSKDDLQSVPSFLAEDILVQGIEELSTSS